MPDILEIVNQKGLRAKFLTTGARWTEMHVPDHQGNFADILLGFSAKADYLRAEEKYYGAVVGRYCGRIPHGTSADQDMQLALPLNDSGHHLHGGEKGFHLQEWEVLPEYTTENSVGFFLFSPDGEEGYPGDLEVRVVYTLTDDDQLIFEAKAHTTQKTLVNITNHAFFNLSGSAQDLEKHTLLIDGDLLAQDQEFLLTGEVITYQKPYEVPLEGRVLSAFRLKRSEQEPVILKSESGRFMKMHTNQPALQLYNGFFMTGADVGKNGAVHYPNAGLALEPQYLSPGSLNVLRPGETYQHKTVYAFGSDIPG